MGNTENAWAWWIEETWGMREVKITNASTFFKPHNKIWCRMSVQIFTYRSLGLPWPPTCTSKRFSLSVTFFNPAWEEKCILQPHIDHMTTNLAVCVCDVGSTRWRSSATDARPQPRSDHYGASLKMKAAAQTAKTNHYINSVTLTVALIF